MMTEAWTTCEQNFPGSYLPWTSTTECVKSEYLILKLGLNSSKARLLTWVPLGVRHVSCVTRENALFMKHCGDRAIVSVQNPVQLSDYTEPQPDIVMLKPRRDFYAGKKISWEDALL